LLNLGRCPLPRSAIVRDGGLDDTEFFLGAVIDFGRPAFFTGAEVDIDANSITFTPRRLLTDIGIGGCLFIEIGSLDWVGSPNGIISDIIAAPMDFDPSSLTVTHTDHSVRIAIENTALEHNTVVTVALITSHAVPIPATLFLIVLGLGLITVRRPNPSLS
jgi:hypothetical protein